MGHSVVETCRVMCSTVEVHIDAVCVLVAVPGPVSLPAVNELGSHHVKLTWNEPQQINGIPRGYVISCREGQCDKHLYYHRQ